MPSLRDLKIKIFADGADVGTIQNLRGDSLIKGFTTNPALMRKAGVEDYKGFAMQALEAARGHPISFEVIADTDKDILKQARIIAQWGKNVFVKIPIMNTAGRSMRNVIGELGNDGIQVNVTAITHFDQVVDIFPVLSEATASYVSIFAGRIADTGVDPASIVSRSRYLLHHAPKTEIIWASPREVFNIQQAQDAGAHIITVTSDLLAKLKLWGKDLNQYSLETVQLFHSDAQAAGHSID